MSNGKDIFISYRRDGGEFLASLLYQRLNSDGYSVFLDVESLRSGKFNEQLYQVIEACTDFLLILPPKGLDRCVHPDDWVRLEIERAVDLGKNIVPVMMRGFTWPETLPEKLRDLPLANGVTADTELFDGVLLRLEKKLLRSEAQGKTEEKVPLSQQLKDTLAGIDYDKNKTSVTETIRRKKADHFMQSLAQRMAEYETRKAQEPCEDTAETYDPQKYGCYFSIVDEPNANTIVYQIHERYDEKMLVRYCEPDRLVRASEQMDDCWIRSYYILPEDIDEDGEVSLALLTFKDRGEKIDIFVNTGVFLGKEVRITKDPMLIDSAKKSAFSKSEMTLLGNLSEEQKEYFKSGRGSEKYWKETTGPLNWIVIDLLTLEEAQREVYFDEEKHQIAAQIRLKSTASYFAFVISFKDDGYEVPLTNHEIGSAYRTGSHGFPKDLMKAGEYLEKDGSADALYQIGLMFRDEEEIRDPQIAASYFQRAAESGSEEAREILGSCP